MKISDLLALRIEIFDPAKNTYVPAFREAPGGKPFRCEDFCTGWDEDDRPFCRYPLISFGDPDETE